MYIYLQYTVHTYISATACLISFKSPLLPKQLLFIEAWTPKECPVVSGTKILVADPLSSTNCEVGPPYIESVGPTLPN